MEQHNNKLLPHLIELKNEIQTNPYELTFNTIHQTREWLHSITLQLDGVQNSKLPINRVIPDILYNIFSLAIYDSTHPGKTVLAISYVCRHWRKSVLNRPALWAFIDLNYSDSMVDLFVNRSGYTPLVLSWTQPFSESTDVSSSKSYLESHANLMIPRLCSLTLKIPDTVLAEIQHVFQNAQLSPLQLRHLDLMIEQRSRVSKAAPLTDIFQIDMSYLQRLRLEKVDLPWQVLPENKLTHFAFYPFTPPPLSQILAVLSCCPHLCELEFVIQGSVDDPEDLTTSSTSKLDLPKLKALVLELKITDMPELEYLQRFSACIRTSGSLSRFKLSYDDDLWNRPEPPPFNIFGPVPSGTLSRFAGFHYLFISLILNIETGPGSFRIVSAPEYTGTLDLSSYPLYLSGACPRRTSFDNSPILNLIHSLPEITRLTLCYQSWEILNSWNIDIRRVFPCLNTLELRNLSRDSTNQLNSLCVGLKLKTLILEGTVEMAAETLSFISLKTGIEVLELDKQSYHRVTFQEAIRALRQTGVTVVPFDYRDYNCYFD